MAGALDQRSSTGWCAFDLDKVLNRIPAVIPNKEPIFGGFRSNLQTPD